MKMSLELLCYEVEKSEETAKATLLPEQNQIIVSFSKRPDVELCLLTPMNQKQILSGQMDDNDVIEMLLSIRRIANSF